MYSFIQQNILYYNKPKQTLQKTNKSQTKNKQTQNQKQTKNQQTKNQTKNKLKQRN